MEGRESVGRRACARRVIRVGNSQDQQQEGRYRESSSAVGGACRSIGVAEGACRGAGFDTVDEDQQQEGRWRGSRSAAGGLNAQYHRGVAGGAEDPVQCIAIKFN